MSAAVTAQGRIFFIVDEAPLASVRFLSDWKLVARDAFNGTLLWKRPIGAWVDHLRHFRSGPVTCRAGWWRSATVSISRPA